MRRAIYNAAGTGEGEPRLGESGFPPVAGEYAVLCTDGRYEEPSDRRTGRSVRRFRDDGCLRIARQLVEATDRHGGNDDIEAIVVRK